MRPFRFLGIAGHDITTAKQLADTARQAEAMGYSGLVASDHLTEQHAPVPVLATIAAATERLRIGTFVLNNGLRHPAVLAQELATLDVLSEGRLEIGLGTGWNRPEHEAIGLPFDPANIRVARLAEAVTVLKGCFGDGPFHFSGRHFTITGLDGRPKPVQRPHPPFFVGGGGRGILSLAGRQADIVGLAPRLLPGAGEPRPDPRSLTAAATEEKIRWVRAAAGDRFAGLELNTYPTIAGAADESPAGPVVVTNHARAEAERRATRLRELTGVPISGQEILDSPLVFIGSVDGLVEKCLAMRERFGISSIMVGRIDELAPVVARLAGS